MKSKINKIKILLVAICVLAGSLSVYLGVGIIGQVAGFSKEKLTSEESSTQISLTDNQEYYSYSGAGVRKNVEYNDIPEVMIDAVVAAEDSRFYEHNGFDLPRILKALMGNIAARGITSGGSTITQQLIKKSYYPDEQRTITRKLGEVILSIRASSVCTKEEILTMYLNRIYFGYGNKAIGIYAASRYYFGKSVQQLTLPEAALLAGSLNSPNQYDPFANLEKAQARRDTILKLMYNHGYISKKEYEDTLKIPVENTLKYDPLSASSDYQAYADMVTREVYLKTGYDPNETSMTIYTYMDPDIQTSLDDIASGKTYTFADEDLQCGAIVQDVWNGRVVGVLSARNYTAMDSTNAYAKPGAKKDEVTYGNVHQPGSSLKPIISYAAAFEFLDYSTAHLVHDIPLDLGGGKVANNWDNKFHGDVTIKNALQNSWNGAAMETCQEVLDEISTDKYVSYLEGFGLDMSDETFRIGYAMGSWDYGTTPQCEASAYACIANGGTYYESHCVSKIIINSTGEEIDFDQTIQNNASQAISEDSAFMIRSVMTDYVSDAKGAYSYLGALKLNIGAKSGTSSYSSSDSNKYLAGKAKDNWLSAYSADYSWSVWVGYPESVARSKNKYLHGGDNRKLSAVIGKAIHPNGVQHSYPAQPTTVVEKTCISGIYPYVSPTSTTPSSRKITGYFKSDNIPVKATTSAATISSLSNFSVGFNGTNITYSFGKYSGSTKGNYKTYKVGGKSYTLPYYGDLSGIYGNIVYKIIVKDEDGNEYYSATYSSSSGTIRADLPNGTYDVTGYYTYSSGAASSNEMTKEVVVNKAVIEDNTDDETEETVETIEDTE